MGQWHFDFEKELAYIGAVDLVIAWIVSFVILSTGAEIESILMILIASAGLLGLVTYLNQTYEGEMAKE